MTATATNSTVPTTPAEHLENIESLVKQLRWADEMRDQLGKELERADMAAHQAGVETGGEIARGIRYHRPYETYIGVVTELQSILGRVDLDADS